MHEWAEKCTQLTQETSTEESLESHRHIGKLISEKYGVKVWSVFTWLKTGSRGGYLYSAHSSETSDSINIRRIS
jgi:hypothetical protein